MAQRRYVNGVDVSGVALGEDAGVSLTTGVDNVLLGQRAGAGLVTGSHNTVIGGYRADTEPGLSNAVVLSDATGAVRARWDASGNAVFACNDIATVPDGTQQPTNTVTLGINTTTGAVVCRTRTADGAVRDSLTMPADTAVVALSSVSLPPLVSADIVHVEDNASQSTCTLGSVRWFSFSRAMSVRRRTPSASSAA